MYLSVNGIVTFERSHALRETVAKIPIERLLLETDCPYLAPVPLRGKRNEPSFVRYVAQTVAQIKKLSFEEIAQATTRKRPRALWALTELGCGIIIAQLGVP
jgi:TatD DNase family protein